MIAVTPNPATMNSSAPGAPATAAPAVASPFDAILTLESLAATCAALDSSPLGGGALEGSSLEGLDETTEDSDPDGEEPLAFLAGLFSVAAPPPPASSTPAAANDDAVEAAIDDALGGQAKHSASPDGQVATSDTTAPSAATGATTSAATATDVAMAGKLLAGMDPAAANDAVDASTDATTAQDAAAGIARAAEWLSHGPRHVAGAARDSIPTPVHSPRWAEDFGARVALMVRGGESSASLQLTPVDLGPVDINVTVRDSQASIHFGAAQAETRALLEASIPRLREMLAAQGFNLLDASVSQGFARQSRPDVHRAIGSGAEAEAEVREVTRITGNGLLDLYA